MTARRLAPTRFLALGIAALLVPAPSCSTRPLSHAGGTTPMTLEMGSPVVTLHLRAKDGSERATRFLVDTGGGAFMLTEAVARELGLEVERDKSESEGGTSYAPMETPHATIDGFPLDLAGARCAAVLGRSTVLEGGTPEGFLPGHVLARHHVVFDYPAGRFTLARPGSVEPRGRPVPSPISEGSGFPRIELQVAGETRGFLLDTGASFTMVSITELERWQAADATLATMTGAVGEANMVGGPMESGALLMRAPTLAWGPFALERVAAVARPAGTFEKWMSQMMSAPIVGAIGGNVLRHFRVEIDYANGTTYLEPRGQDFGTVLDAVGLVLGETSEGAQRVDALAVVDGAPVCQGVEVGDLVRAVDGRSLAGLRHRQVIELLRGEPGTSRTLALERDGQPAESIVSVVRFLDR